MDNKIVEIFIPGPAGRLEAKYYKSKKNTSPIALVLQPHPQYGGTMNNKVVVETFHTFMEKDFSVCRVNFRGVGKSDGEFDNGQGELADAAAALDWLERENFDNSQCWVSGFSFGSLIAMQLLTPNELRGRVLSFETTVQGTTWIGTLIMGSIAEYLTHNQIYVGTISLGGNAMNGAADAVLIGGILYGIISLIFFSVFGSMRRFH